MAVTGRLSRAEAAVPIGDRLLAEWWSTTGRLRGLWWRSFLRDCGEGLRVDAGAKMRNPSRVSVGRNVWLKEGVLLDGRSDHPVGVRLDDQVSIRAYAYVDAYGGSGFVHVGSRSGIGPYAYLGGNGGLEIGQDVMISGHTMIVAANHRFDPGGPGPYMTQGETRRGIRIHDNVWIAAQAVILDGVEVGRGAVVAAGAVVTRDVAPYTLVGGCPARPLRPLLGEGETVARGDHHA
ncbi:DapH/DapD/GlmU-related protein [Phytohabitans flavus]